MSLRLLFYSPTTFQFRSYKPLSVARSSFNYNPCTHRVSTSAMSNRPKYQGGRRGGAGRGRSGGGGGGRGAGGRGGGRGGEQSWWDPAWRAERLRQKAAEMEVMSENEWWGKIEQFKRGGEQEMIIKRNFSRDDQGRKRMEF